MAAHQGRPYERGGQTWLTPSTRIRITKCEDALPEETQRQCAAFRRSADVLLEGARDRGDIEHLIKWVQERRAQGFFWRGGCPGHCSQAMSAFGSHNRPPSDPNQPVSPSESGRSTFALTGAGAQRVSETRQQRCWARHSNAGLVVIFPSSLALR
jgi:hypothetical protein